MVVMKKHKFFPELSKLLEVVQLIIQDGKMADQILKPGVSCDQRYNPDLHDTLNADFSPPAVRKASFVIPVRLSKFHMLAKVSENEEVTSISNELQKLSTATDAVPVTVDTSEIEGKGRFKRAASSPSLYSLASLQANNDAHTKKKVSGEIYRQQVQGVTTNDNLNKAAHKMHRLKAHGVLVGEDYSTVRNQKTAQSEIYQFTKSSQASKSVPTTPITTPASTPASSPKLNRKHAINDVAGHLEVARQTTEIQELSTSPRRGLLHYFGLGYLRPNSSQGNLQKQQFDDTDAADKRMTAYNAISNEFVTSQSKNPPMIPKKISVRSKDLNVFAPGAM